MKKITQLFSMLVICVALLSHTNNAIAQTATPQHLTKSGAVDKRFKSAKTTTATAPTPAAHTKADGTLDKRYKANKSTAATPPTPTTAPQPSVSTPSAAAPSPQTSATAPTGKHLNKDGSLDMRYKENRTPGVDKNGKPDMRYKKNKQH